MRRIAWLPVSHTTTPHSPPASITAMAWSAVRLRGLSSAGSWLSRTPGPVSVRVDALALSSKSSK